MGNGCQFSSIRCFGCEHVGCGVGWHDGLFKTVFCRCLPVNCQNPN